ncbi:TrmH family RNA methyltransferase [Pedobacter cryophilus]|uniref:RNA methyltransferase n=1 Tax=Pedobacter cryophilus TaxID=2571271 RepID=A0A4U1BTY3_9SPHI|nr:RNA methyltransferase [Pedobacter cryophilus]TKB95612.1 RNA methyltransferase [Pedobacter cryophilus]
MLSKSQISLIKSLYQKKYRKEHQLFLVEGFKAISEFINSNYVIHSVYCVKDMISNLPKSIHKQKVFEVTVNELEKISTLQTPQGILAILEIPHFQITKHKDIIIVLDGVQDPGNLGTIIRTADWFGFREIICSENTVDVYNPKVIQATMGSLARVNISYQPLIAVLKNSTLPKYGTLLNGENVFNINWPKEGFLIFGSEGKGISSDILDLITHPVTIPGSGQTESLNVGISAAICCAEIKRNTLK